MRKGVVAGFGAYLSCHHQAGCSLLGRFRSRLLADPLRFTGTSTQLFDL
jgi:hypothetical protein